MSMLAELPRVEAPAAPPHAPLRWTVEDLLRELGDIPAGRVRLCPAPGTATEADLLALKKGLRHVELVDGTFVEKAVGAPQASVEILFAHFVLLFALPRGIGFVPGADTDFRMAGGNIRKPDTGFMRLDRLPCPRTPIIDGAPDLCVEVLSPGNTAAEMAIKRVEYFASGCRIVWEVETELRSVAVYTSAGAPDATVGPDGVLEGGAVLPGFSLDLAELWAAWDRTWPNA